MPLPRIIRLASCCIAPRHLTYLQHVMKAYISDSDSHPISGCKLPSTLRELLLFLHDWRDLKADTLPPRLTLLVLLDLDTIVLQPGVLPQSLRTLGLLYTRAVRESTDPNMSTQPIAAGVLPSQLQRLEIMWSRSLADLALPASLIQLDLLFVPNLPIPPNCLPAGLQTLSIFTRPFDPQHLRGALPAGLRVLRLSCVLSQPLPAALLAEVPQLKELAVTYQHRLSAGLLTPLTQLRVLRLYILRVNSYRHPIAAGELPASLRRLVLVVEGEQSEKESAAEELVPLAVRHAGLVVDCLSGRSLSTLADQFRAGTAAVDPPPRG